MNLIPGKLYWVRHIRTANNPKRLMIFIKSEKHKSVEWTGIKEYYIYTFLYVSKKGITTMSIYTLSKFEIELAQ